MEATAAASSAPARASKSMLALSVTLFFGWGFATVLVDTLIPRLKAAFSLGYAEVMLTQFSFFLAYLVVSIPAGILIARFGYIRSIVFGLLAMAAGCLLFSPAAFAGVYPGFLLALFVMAGGITILQVAANPLVAILGSSQTSHARLTLAQAFNSLGTTIGPLVGSALILGASLPTPDAAQHSPLQLESYRRAAAHSVETPFLGIAAVLLVLAIVFWFHRRGESALPAQSAMPSASLAPFKQRRLALGALSIFVYVGAEVSIGSLLIVYLMQHSILGVDAARGGQLISFYWGGAMVGRFLGAGIMRRVPASTVLAACALGAVALTSFSAASLGIVAAVAILAVGLCNSIMFPTIFALAIERLGSERPQGSGLLCLAIVGGAVVPLAAGALADAFGLSAALLLPAACYLWIAAYGMLARTGALD